MTITNVSVAALGVGCETGAMNVDSATFAADWQDAQSEPVKPVNQAVCQLGMPLTAGGRTVPAGLYLTLGHINPPVFIGDDETKRQQLDAMGGQLKVSIGGRYILTREFAQQLVDLLQTSIKTYDDQVVVEAESVEARGHA